MPKTETSLQSIAIADLKKDITPYLADELLEYFGRADDLDMVDIQALHLLATGKPLDMAAVDAALPENVKGLIKKK